MTSREKMRRALTEGRDCDFPVVIPYVGIFERDHWEEFTDVPFWHRQYGTDEQQLAWMRDLLDAVPMDWLQVPFGTSRRWFETHEVIEKDGQWYVRDRQSDVETLLQRQPPGGQQVVQSARKVLVERESDIESAVPSVRAEPWVEGGCLELPRRARQAFPDQCLVTAVGAPFWHCHAYLGFEGMFTAVTERPRLLEALLEKITANAVEQVRAYELAGVYDAVWVEDCYSSADLISLDQFRRFAAPYVGRVIEAVNAAGMASIYYFCGKLDERLEDLIALGPTAIGLEESKKDFTIDIGQVAKQAAGRCCVLGNLDAIHTLRNGTPAEVRAAIAEQLDAARAARRFVVSLGSPVTADTPTSRVREYVEWTRELAGD